MKKIFVLGSINIDLCINCERFPVAGETVIGKGFLVNTGGKGANQAVAVAKAGGQALFLGATGTDAWAGKLRSNLIRYGVNCRYLLEKEGTSGIAVIIIINGDNRIIIDPGANHRFGFADFSEVLRRKAGPGDVFISQLEIPLGVVEKALALAKELGMVTILNPAPAQPLGDALYRTVDYLIPNEIEAFALAGFEFDLEKLPRVFEFFYSKGVKNVIITLGKNGSAYYENGKVVVIPAPAVKAVDTTAAGDTFVGAFAVRMLKTGNLQDSILFANHAAALTVTRYGAQQAIPDRGVIEAFLNK